MATGNKSTSPPLTLGFLLANDAVQISLSAPPHLHNKLNPSADSAEGFFCYSYLLIMACLTGFPLTPILVIIYLESAIIELAFFGCLGTIVGLESFVTG